MALSARTKPKATGGAFSIVLQKADQPTNGNDDNIAEPQLVTMRSADHAKMHQVKGS